MDLYKIKNLKSEFYETYYAFTQSSPNGRISVSVFYLSNALGISSTKLCTVMRKFKGVSASGYTHFQNEENCLKAIEWINNAYIAKKLCG